MIKHYEDLEVYQTAYKAALEVHHLTLTFPKIENYELAQQMRRASKGICANIAEGYAKQHNSKPEFKRFLGIALGSSEEMRVWLQFSFDLGYLDKECFETKAQTYSQLSRMISSLASKWK